MADDLSTIDVSRLDGLAKLKADQDALRNLASRAADHRDKVTEVYTRVVRDYEARIQGLEQQAEKLRQEVRDDFGRLQALHDAASTALEQARFDLQESEFRKEIGEYTDEEFKKRETAIESTIAGRQKQLDEITRLRKRFVEVLPTDTPPPAPAPAARRLTDTASGAVVPLPTPARIVTAAQAPPPVPIPPVLESSAGIGETMVVPPPGTGAFQLPVSPADEGATQVLNAPPSFDSVEPFATIAVPSGLLVQERTGAPPLNHRLGALTTIGRTPDNQIVVPSREVSRKHAEIVLGENGYLLRDLGSPNGTFVNGQKVTEHALVEGDRITLAGQSFVFKAR